MANYYIKKINGYLVKDEEARQSIVEIRSTLQEHDGYMRGHDERLGVVEQSITTHTGEISTLKTDYSNAYNLADEALERADEAYDLASDAQDRADDAYALASGINSATVFDTVEAMKAHLKIQDKNAIKIGDQLLIRAVDVPDYWVSGIKDTNTGECGYYEISILETQKVDLTNYVTHGNLTTTLADYTTKDGNYPNMTVGVAESAVEADKVIGALKVYYSNSTTPKVYDGSSEVTIGDTNNPIANAVQAQKATRATGDEDGTNIKNNYALKTYADAYNITFSVTNEELTILKNNQKPFVAPTA